MVPVAGRKRVGGFTLIEVMVVLAIVGVLAGLTVGLLRPNPGQAAEAEAWRLARLVERLGREADLSGQVLALRWHPDGYEFQRRDDEGVWRELTTDGIFASRRFEPSLRLMDSGELRFAPDGEVEPRQWRLATDTLIVAVDLDSLGGAAVHTLDARRGAL